MTIAYHTQVGYALTIYIPTEQSPMRMYSKRHSSIVPCSPTQKNTNVIKYTNKPGTTAPNSVAQGESGRLISEISTYRSHDRNVVLLYVFVPILTGLQTGLERLKLVFDRRRHVYGRK